MGICVAGFIRPSILKSLPLLARHPCSCFLFEWFYAGQGIAPWRTFVSSRLLAPSLVYNPPLHIHPEPVLSLLVLGRSLSPTQSILLHKLCNEKRTLPFLAKDTLIPTFPKKHGIPGSEEPVPGSILIP